MFPDFINFPFAYSRHIRKETNLFRHCDYLVIKSAFYDGSQTYNKNVLQFVGEKEKF